jgi:PIN domain nuclease of toxin-antitoxin system
MCKYRLLIAQAMVEGIPILSKDSAFDMPILLIEFGEL